MPFHPVTQALAVWRRLMLAPAPGALLPPSMPAVPLDIDLTALEILAALALHEETPPAARRPPSGPFDETLPGLKTDAAGWRTQPFVRHPP